MLPQSRLYCDTYAIPQFDLDKEDVKGFMDELRAFQEEFKHFFSRSEMKENLYLYMAGQLSELERKSIEPIALNIDKGSVRSMQRFISDSQWLDEDIMHKYRSMIAADIGCEEGVLIFDESSFPKKGSNSSGVAKQYSGTSGKVENCQVGVFVCYASGAGYALVNHRLFMPELWFDEKYSEKREKCEVPRDLVFQTKPQLAGAMLQEIVIEGNLPFRYVVADSIYGNSPDFREAVEEYSDCIYFLEVPGRLTCHIQNPMNIRRSYTYKGELHTRKFLEQPGERTLTLKTIAENLSSYHWYQRTVSEGTKGPITYEFSTMPVVLHQDEKQGKKQWLIIKRTMGENPVYRYYISNAPDDTKLRVFVWLSGVRWAIEQSFEEGKIEVGMDHYEVRKFTGWYHHVLISMMSLFFLWHLKIRLEKKSTSYYHIAD